MALTIADNVFDVDGRPWLLFRSFSFFFGPVAPPF